MKNKYLAVSIFSVLLSSALNAADLSAGTILGWVSEPLGKTDVKAVTPIVLKGGEKAYIASVEFPEQGRNFWGGYILARPKLKKAILLKNFGGQANEVTTVSDFPSGSHVIIGSGGSGQGVVMRDSFVVYFDGWQAKILHKASSYSNFGTCGEDIGGACEATDSFINVLQTDSSTKAQVVITQVNYFGPNAESLKVSATAKVLTFKAP